MFYIIYFYLFFLKIILTIKKLFSYKRLKISITNYINLYLSFF